VAISINGGGNSRSRRRTYSGAISEINVTPFVDVMLVLLIIFMLTAHVMEFGIQIDVPKVSEVKESAQELPVVNLNRQADLFLNEKPIRLVELADAIHQRFGQSKAVYLRADRQTPWEQVAQVAAALGAAKFQINMVTQPDDSLNKGKQ
jgi:biopolymer transport protein ExbD